MLTKTAIARETHRRTRRLSMQVGDGVHRLRLDAGVSLRALGAATGIDPSHLARIEKGMAAGSPEALTSIAVALGADLSIRFFADAGPRIHDRLQAPMIETLLRSLHADWMPRLEVVVPGDRRGVADVVLTHRRHPVLVVGEAQSQLRRVEQQLRWMSEKAAAFEATHAGTQSVSKLLILRSTVATRRLAAEFLTTFATAFPARSVDLVDALTNGTPWPGDGIVWMRLERGVAELLPQPPRGVRLGR